MTVPPQSVEFEDLGTGGVVSVGEEDFADWTGTTHEVQQRPPRLLSMGQRRARTQVWLL